MAIERIPVPEGFAAKGDGLGGAERRVAAGSAIHLQAFIRRQRHRALNASDGTRQLLVSGFWIMLVGVGAALLTATVFGGMGAQGAHTNAGWLSLMVAMMSTPFAILLLLLGGAKWLRNLGLSKSPPGQ